MKKIYFIFCAMCAIVCASCDNTETYAEQKEREQDIIWAFVATDTYITVGDETLCHVGIIDLIEEDQFLVDTLTRCAENGYPGRNEYVKLNTGVIMQIVRRGAGDMIRPGQSKRLTARYFEYNMSLGYVTSRNTTNEYGRYADYVNVTNQSGTLSGSFDSEVNGGGAMLRAYGSTAVPEGWLTPLHYVRVGNQLSGDEGIAKVRIIVPHSLGHSAATSAVHPYFYEITFEEMYF